MYKKEKITGYVGGFYVNSKDFEVDVFRWSWKDWDKTSNGFLVVINWGKDAFERLVVETDFYGFGEVGRFREIFCKLHGEDMFIAFVEKLGGFLETVNKGNPDVSLKVELHI